MNRRTFLDAWTLVAAFAVGGFAAARLARSADATTLVYFQHSGELFNPASPVLTPFATGYSGAGDHRNNPRSQCIGDLGPIPVGFYTISAMQNIVLPDAPHTTIKDALPLTADANNNMCRRTGFLIHGDSITYPGWASAGCIILPRDKREQISQSGIRRLEVRE